MGAYALEQFAFAKPLPAAALTANQTAAFALDPATIRTVKLRHHTIQAETLDFSKTAALTGFFDLTKTYSDDFTLKNQSFYDSMNHTKYSGYGFTADYVEVVAENKTTVHYKFEPSKGTVLDNIFGASFRYTSGDERESRGRGCRLNGANILDAKYYTPQFLFWDTFISPSQGPTVELSAAYKW